MKYRYRETGEMKFVWFGKIAKEFEMKKGKYLYYNEKIKNNNTEKNVLSLTLNGVIDRDITNISGLQPESFDGYQKFKKDDLVFKLIDLENIKTSRVGYVHKNGIMSPAYIRLTPKVDIFSYYYYYFYFSLYIRNIYNSLGSVGVRSAINASELLELKIPFPNKEVQQKIANFLEKKTSEFDSAISKKEKLIEKLEEAKKSLISEVVTGKLKVTNMKEKWIEKKLGYIFSFKNGVNADGHQYGSGIKFINIKEVINNQILTYEDIPNLVNIDKNQIEDNLVKKGDILFNRTSETIEELGLTSVYVGKEKVVFGGFVIRGQERKKELTTNFKKYCFSSTNIRSQIISFGNGSIRKNIGKSNLKNVSITYPQEEVQIIIADYLDKKTSELDSLISKQTQIIKKLNLAKQSLISEVVTGKIEIL